MNHKKFLGSTQLNKKVTSFFNQSNDSIDEVTKAEVIFTNFLTEHNIRFLVADHFTLVSERDVSRLQYSKTVQLSTNEVILHSQEALAPSFDKTDRHMPDTEVFSHD